MLSSLRKKMGGFGGGVVGAPDGASKGPVWASGDSRGVPPHPPPPLTQPATKKAPAADGPRSPASPSSPSLTRRQIFERAIERDTIDLREVQKLSRLGVPDDLRAVYWKVLLRYLPLDRAQWDDTLHRKREEYKTFRSELFVHPDSVQAALERHEKQTEVHRVPSASSLKRKASVTSKNTDSDSDEEEQNDEGEAGDHPLNASNDSVWARYLHNQHVLTTIDVDVPRTMPSLHFFNNEDPPGEDLHDVALMVPAQGRVLSRHHQHLRRLLFIFARLNPGLGYVQGMNEIAGHLFYTFAKADPDGALEHAETDAFYCFTALISFMGHHFCRSLDGDQLGIKGSLGTYSELFKKCDNELATHLDKQGICPEFYSFRWITLLLSQEFSVPDVLRIWDYLFSGEVVDNLYFTTVAMVISIRDKLLNGDFSTNMAALQDLPPLEVDEVLTLAMQLSDEHG